MSAQNFLKKISERIPQSVRGLLLTKNKPKAPTQHVVALGESDNCLLLDGKPWAVHLTWSQETNTQISTKDARTLTKGENHDLFIINNLTQLGTIESNSQVKEKTPVLAPAIAAYIGNPDFLAAIPIDDEHIYLLTSENGAFRSFFENIIPTHDAKAQFQDVLLQFIHLKAVIIAPKSWDIDEAHEIQFRDIIAELSKSYVLRSVNSALSKKTIGMGLAGIVVCVGGYKLYHRYKHQQALDEYRLQMQVESENQAQAQLLSIPILPNMPTTGQERAIDTIKTCYRQIPTVPMSMPGWKTTGIDCDGKNISISLVKNKIGTVNWLAPYAKTYRDKKPKISWSPSTPDNATITWEIHDPAGRTWKKTDGQNPDRIARYLYSNMSEIYTLDKYSLSPPEHQHVRTKTVGQKDVTINSPWTVQTLTLKINGRLRRDILDLTSRIQNAVMTSFHLTTENSTYTITESIYHYSPPSGPAEIIPEKN